MTRREWAEAELERLATLLLELSKRSLPETAQLAYLAGRLEAVRRMLVEDDSSEQI